MPETAPEIEFDENGVCLACQRAEVAKSIKWNERMEELKNLCDTHRSLTGNYDCIIPVSGGKDSFFQVNIIKNEMGMNPLLVSVTDEWKHTRAGQHNSVQISRAFRCDMITLRLNPDMVKETTRWGFENIGSTNWAIDKAIYAWPLQMAIKLGIKLVVYGENVQWEYGYKTGVDTYDARDQINNSVVNVEKTPMLWAGEDNCLKYPSVEEMEEYGLQPIYLSYFTGWDGMRNLEVAKRFGFKTLEGEWNRDGYIDDFWQIDSIGYLMNYHIKFAKYGYSKATDVASHLIRCGKMTREEAVELVKKEEGRLDSFIFDDFSRLTGYSLENIRSIMDKWLNEKLFKRRFDGMYVLKEEDGL